MAEIWEAIQPYRGWIIFGIFLLLMMRMHAGGGCGMGHGAHGSRGSSNEQPTNQTANDSAPRRAANETDRGGAESLPVSSSRSGGCH
jgi:hypothetical protein